MAYNFGRAKLIERMQALAARIGPVERALEVGIAGDRGTDGSYLPGANREFFQAARYDTADKLEVLNPDFVIDLEHPETIVGWEWADLVICSQTLEHVYDIRAAARSLMLLTKPNGYCIVDTPYAAPPHEGGPGVGDYWRLTPQGLERLLCEAGFLVEDLFFLEPEFVSALCKKPR